MKSDYRISFVNRLSRFILRPVLRGILYIFSPITITGQENIPSKGAYLVAINHISLFEAPFIVAFWPVELEALGAVDIWHRTGQSVLARLYGGIPVHRGTYDRQVFDTLQAALRSGRPILIAPEGGRSHSPGMRQAYPGVAYLMEKAGVPVLPVGIVGTTDDYLKQALHGKRPKLEMHIGKPIHLPSIHGIPEKRRLARQQNADMVMGHIAAQLPVEYRGFYADYPIQGACESEEN
jgi:1-acyl-sn-glycerol-3-phosphate acyltransferase